MTPSGLSLPQRAAGLVSILNGLVLLAERALVPEQPGILSRSPAPAAIDVLLGLALAAGFEGVLGWVMLRAALGGVVVTAILLATGNPGLALLQVFYSGMLLMLLIPHAGKVRATLAGLMAACFLGLQGLGLAVVASGEDASEAWVSRVIGPERDGESEGVAVADRQAVYGEPTRDPYPEDALVACTVGGAVTFMRESDCRIQGGRF